MGWDGMEWDDPRLLRALTAYRAGRRFPLLPASRRIMQGVSGVFSTALLPSPALLHLRLAMFCSRHYHFALRFSSRGLPASELVCLPSASLEVVSRKSRNLKRRQVSGCICTAVSFPSWCYRPVPTGTLMLTGREAN